MNKLVRKNKKGFTLTEMIVVIAIIGILAAVMIPSVVIYVNKARQSAADQEAAGVRDVYEAYYTEKEAGLISLDNHCVHYTQDGANYDENNVCSTEGCGKTNPEKDGDNVYLDFSDYYNEVTGKVLVADYNAEENTLTITASNGEESTIDLSDFDAASVAKDFPA